jgi:hypothetical protein
LCLIDFALAPHLSKRWNPEIIFDLICFFIPASEEVKKNRQVGVKGTARRIETVFLSTEELPTFFVIGDSFCQCAYHRHIPYIY